MTIFFFSNDNGLIDTLSKEAKDKNINLSILDLSHISDEVFSHDDHIILDTEDQSILNKLSKKKVSSVTLITDPSTYQKYISLEEKKIDFLLQKPLPEDWVRLLFSILQTPSSEEYQLLKEYQKTVFDKLYNIVNLINNVSKDNPESIVTLKKAVHKMAGSAGSYGYLQVSELCKKEEQVLENNNKIVKEELINFLQKLVDAFSQLPKISSPPEKESNQSIKKSEKLDIFLIDDDKDFTRLIEDYAKKSNLNIKTENSFGKALEIITNQGFFTNVILFDLISENESLTGFDLIEKFLENKPKELQPIIGIISSKSQLEYRAKSLDFAIDLYFQKPVAPEVLVENILPLLVSTESEVFNVLLVDDDPSFAKIMLDGMKNSNVKLNWLEKPEYILQGLQDHSYHLILLDYDMPNLSGLQVLRILQSDVLLCKIPVIFVTSSDRSDLLKQVMMLGAKGFISKPVQPEDLLDQILNFLRKQKVLQMMISKDPTIGINQKDTLNTLSQTLFTELSNFSVCVIFFKFPEDQKSNVKKAWYKICEIFINFFGQKEIMGLWEDFQLVIIFKYYKIYQLHSFINFIFNKIEKEQLVTLPEKTNLLASIVSYPNDGSSLQELVESAKSNFEEIKEFQSFQVMFNPKDGKNALTTLKTVFLICSNTYLVEILEYALSLQNIKVKIARDGFEAIQTIEKIMFQNSLDLILFDFDLIDQTGYALTSKLVNLLGEKIPFVLLSSETKEEQIMEKSQFNNVVFISKPFNLPLLVRIIMRLL